MKAKLLAAFIAALVITVTVHAQDPVPPTPPAPPPTQSAPAQPAAATPAQTPAPTEATAKPAKLLVKSGTKLPLVLHNSISTRSAQVGDSVYLETLFPIIADNKILIPAGSYVSGEITEVKRAGKVKGRAELMVKLNNLVLPNGYVVDFNAIPTGSAGTGSNDTVDDEGKIKGDSDKSGDAGVMLKTTSIGAGVGGLATRTGKGTAIGAGAGAAAGLIAMLLTRGPDLELPRGTTLDVMLDRPLYLDADKINFTDPGRASALAGAPNNRPTRSRIPF
jgi:type IV secretion system protein VirB10